jgi:hypothetical protein
LATGVTADPAIVKWGRRALGLVAVGLVMQIGTTFYWTPGTFIVSAALGLPLVLLGAAIFGWAVLRTRVGDRAPRDGGA